MVIGVDNDKLILTDSANCEKFQEVEDSIEVSDEWVSLFYEHLPDEYLNDNLYDWLRSETGYTEYDLMQMSDVATYVFTA